MPPEGAIELSRIDGSHTTLSTATTDRRWLDGFPHTMLAMSIFHGTRQAPFCSQRSGLDGLDIDRRQGIGWHGGKDGDPT